MADDVSNRALGETMPEIERLPEMSVEEWAYFKLAAMEHRHHGASRAFLARLSAYFEARERAERA